MNSRPTIRNRILGELWRAGDDGLTDSELATLLGANKNHVPCRRRDVELNGLCRKTSKRRDTNTGTSAIVHVITPEGISWARTGKPVPGRPSPGGDKTIPKIVTIEHRRGDRVVDRFKVTTETKGRLTTLVFPAYITVLRGDEVHILS